MYYVYVLQSLKDNNYYIGYTSNPDDRIRRHNTGRSVSTKNRVPFILIYQESFATRSDAMKREREIKRFKGGNNFKKLLIKNKGR